MSAHPPETGDPTNPLAAGQADAFERLIDERLSRRTVLRGLTAMTALAALNGCRSSAAAHDGPSLPHPLTDDHEVADGHDAHVLIRWGDPVLPGAPDHADLSQLNVADQSRQFGFNNDYIAYWPLPLGSDNSRHGLLCINHEYTDAEMMWPGLVSGSQAKKLINREQADIELAAHGFSVIEVRREGDRWTVVKGSPYARRFTGETPMEIRGPARGHRKMKMAVRIAR